ncbi:MAG: type II toxin-antitoxin system RelE/ParE family toxin [Chthoniobacterales bacterium]|nr:type II toxin-antitoxin system RelE/ParE family toxin [Chthoniobacterales bacterium]
MDRKLVWTERASGDIEAIVRYIERRDPGAAARIGFGIYDRAQILFTQPEAGTILDELRDGGWRKLIFLRWKIVYTIRDENIIIGRVWPSAMGEADLQTPLD